MKRSLLCVAAALLLTLTAATACQTKPGERWSVEKAQAWYAAQPWPVGCVYMPSYGGTPVEIWGKEYFNPEVVDRELGLAEGLGFNAIRIFLCDIVWQDDPDGFMERLEETVRLADKHGLRILMTFFTNGGTIKNPYLGPQPQPVPGVHNSVWIALARHRALSQDGPEALQGRPADPGLVPLQRAGEHEGLRHAALHRGRVPLGA